MLLWFLSLSLYCFLSQILQVPFSFFTKYTLALALWYKKINLHWSFMIQCHHLHLPAGPGLPGGLLNKGICEHHKQDLPYKTINKHLFKNTINCNTTIALVCPGWLYKAFKSGQKHLKGVFKAATRPTTSRTYPTLDMSSPSPFFAFLLHPTPSLHCI